MLGNLGTLGRREGGGEVRGRVREGVVGKRREERRRRVGEEDGEQRMEKENEEEPKVKRTKRRERGSEEESGRGEDGGKMRKKDLSISNVSGVSSTSNLPLFTHPKD